MVKQIASLRLVSLQTQVNITKVHKILLDSALFELFEIKIISPPKQEQNKET